MNNKLLVEKYRPRKIEDFIGNKEIVEITKTFIKEKHIPHLILCGSSSTGKTSLVHILANTLFDPSIVKERVLELNSSEYRGIRVIRNKVKKYVSSSIDITLKSSAKFKMIIIDEADTLSLDSQYALRRILEDSSKTTRFILICNNTNKIIPPIMSRCMILNFKDIDGEEIRGKLQDICKKENIQENYIEKSLANCNNDLRVAISLLEQYNKEFVAEEDEQVIINWKSVLNLSNTFQNLVDLLNDGYEPIIIIQSLMKYIIEENNFEMKKLENIISLCADTCVRLSFGCSPLIQLSNIVFFIQNVEKS